MQYRIFAENLPFLVRLAEKLNRRASKLGLLPITVTKVGDEYEDNEDGLTRDHFYLIDIEGTTPRLDGYEFAATIQHAGEAGNILRTVPTFGGTLPERFRTADPGNCDHCKKWRRRNDTFIVMNEEGAFFQVGSNCLADFVGTEKVHALAALAEMLSLLAESAEAMGGEREGRGEPTLLLEPAVAWAAEAMFRMGWISRTKAREQEKTATVDVALGAIRNKGKSCTWKCHQPCLQHFVPTQAAETLAAKVLAWAPTWIERELKRQQDSDYIWNMSVVLAGETITERSYGLAASVLGAYQREMERNERLARERADAPVSEWIGTVGEKLIVSLTIKAFRWIDTDFGTSTLITYNDAQGNVVKWFASGKHSPVEGETATLEMTVKDHKEYNGTKETHVLRVKPYLDKAAKAEIAKQKKTAKLRYESLQKEADDAWASLPPYGDELRDAAMSRYNEARNNASKAYQEWKSL